ncbi:helix-turn-helix domain-containing protein [Paenibacillus oryzisoli]|uniref:helix-turn-helix domain-containing protein n=1 Tax=Paenibacillus oryzisoli TaxID=1850517 RepID=UPI003D282CB2
MFHEYNDLVTVDEFAEMLRIGKNVAYKIVNLGEVKSFKIGGTHKILKESIIEYIIASCSRRESD